MKKSLLILTLLLVCLPLIGAEAARALPIDLYPTDEDLAGRWFLFPQVKAVLLTVIRSWLWLMALIPSNCLLVIAA